MAGMADSLMARSGMPAPMPAPAAAPQPSLKAALAKPKLPPTATPARVPKAAPQAGTPDPLVTKPQMGPELALGPGMDLSAMPEEKGSSPSLKDVLGMAGGALGKGEEGAAKPAAPAHMSPDLVSIAGRFRGML